MRLYILRHGEAGYLASTDAARELTDRGRAQTKMLAQRVSAMGLKVDQALVSPYVRAQQTADIAVPAFAGAVAESCDVITPDDDPRYFVENILSHCPESVLLVSHQPFVGALIDYLTEGRFGATFHSPHPPMLTSSLAALEADFWAPGCARLLWLRSAPDF